MIVVEGMSQNVVKLRFQSNINITFAKIELFFLGQLQVCVHGAQVWFDFFLPKILRDFDLFRGPSDEVFFADRERLSASSSESLYLSL